MPQRGRGRRLAARFASAVQLDIDEAFAYINKDNVAAARELLKRIRACVERISGFPDSGAILSPEHISSISFEVRMATAEPYMLFYTSCEDEIVVLRVLHSRRHALGELFDRRNG